MKIVITMCKLFFAMSAGIYLNKKGILTKDVNKKISSMILDVTMPLLILCSSASVSGDDQQTILFLLIAGIVLYLLLPGISYIIVKILRCPKHLEGVYRCMIIFSNTAFMGYPVVEALYGSKAILYATVLHFGFNVLFFSYGMFLMARDAGDVTKFEAKQLVNVGVISGVIALVLCFTGIQLPEIIYQPFEFIGNTTMPLSMVVIGANMGDYSLREIFEEKKLYYVTFIRLVVMPVLAAVCIRLFTNDLTVIGVTTITIGMPIAASVAMGSGRYEVQGKMGSMAVAFSTICSMITLPILALAIDFVFG